MTVLLDSRPHADAAKAAITAALGSWQAYDYGEVPGADGNAGALPNIYALVTVERMSGMPLRMSAQASRAGWRITARCVGRTPDECRWALAKVAAALNEVSLTVSGAVTSPIQFESDHAPAPDAGLISGMSLWTYTHP